MKPVVFSLAATACYALCAVMIELKFSKINNLTLMIVYASVISVAALATRQLVKTDDPSFGFPTGTTLALAIVLGLIFTVADYCYIGAYNSGGKLATITSITLLVPVFASLIKFGLTQQVPNLWQVSGYVLAACGVALVAKGGMTK
jgi:drug/metabolite transporter (DMT)-like permease